MKIKVKLSDKTKQELKGIQGVSGEQGIQGVKGDKGDKGDMGERGIQGIKGDTGLKGLDGKTGKEGKKGLKGEKGLEGTSGKDGTDGQDGSPDTGEQIKDKINVDRSGKKIDSKHLDIPQVTQLIGGLTQKNADLRYMQGTLTPNTIPKATGVNTLGDSSITDDGTTVITLNKVGIGTVTPGTKLHVAGTVATDMIRTDIGMDINLVPTPTPPSLALIASPGNVDAGLHYYRITYYTSLGETGASPATSITTDASNGQVTVTIPTSTDSRVTGRRIYRSPIIGGASFLTYLLTNITNNTATSYIDNIADASLGTKNGYFVENTTTRYITIGGVASMLIGSGTEPNVILGKNAGAGFFTGTATAGANVLIGAGAGNAITTGNKNNAIGFSALGLLTTGSDNIGIGWGALYNLLTNSANILIGRSSGYYLRGDQNIGIGSYSLQGITPSSGAYYNSALGYQTLTAITTGTYNVAVGYQAGATNSSGGSNIYIGRLTADNHTTGSSNIFIGDRIDSQNVTGSNQMSIGNLLFSNGITGTGTTVSTGGLGIAVVTPTARLHLPAGTATTNTAPLKFNSGTLLTTAEAGAVEFLTDDYYATITTGAARKTIAWIPTQTNVTGSRLLNTTYTAPATRSIMVMATVRCAVTVAGGNAYVQGKSDTATPPTVAASGLVGIQAGLLGEDNTFQVCFTVAAGKTYIITSAATNGTTTLDSWFETVF